MHAESAQKQWKSMHFQEKQTEHHVRFAFAFKTSRNALCSWVIGNNTLFFLKSPTTQQCITMKTQPAKAGSAFRQIGADVQKLSALADLVRPTRSLGNVLAKIAWNA